MLNLKTHWESARTLKDFGLQGHKKIKFLFLQKQLIWVYRKENSTKKGMKKQTGIELDTFL